MEIWVDFVDLDEFAGFLTRNNFNLARLLVFTWIEFNYSVTFLKISLTSFVQNLDSILNCIMESHQKRVNFKERCNNVAEKLQIKTKYLLHPNPNPDPDNDGVEVLYCHIFTVFKRLFLVQTRVGRRDTSSVSFLEGREI